MATGRGVRGRRWAPGGVSECDPVTGTVGSSHWGGVEVLGGRPVGWDLMLFWMVAKMRKLATL